MVTGSFATFYAVRPQLIQIAAFSIIDSSYTERQAGGGGGGGGGEGDPERERTLYALTIKPLNETSVVRVSFKILATASSPYV